MTALVVGLLPVLAPAQPPPPSADPEITQHTSVTGRVKRAYSVFAPEGLKGPAPVVMVLHGGWGKAEQMRQLGFEDAARTNGWRLVYPQSMGLNWNDGRDFSGRLKPTRNIDDVGFLTSIMDKMVAEKLAKPDAFFVAGVSNGGMMALRMACERADRVAGVASVIALMPEPLAKTCRPARPVPMVFITAMDDELMPVQGGQVAARLDRDRGRVISLNDTLAFWQRVNGCMGLPDSHYLQDLDPLDGTTAHYRGWPACRGGSALVSYTLAGAGHQWPGRPANVRLGRVKGMLGRPTHELDGATAIMAFFNAFAEQVPEK